MIKVSSTSREMYVTDDHNPSPYLGSECGKLLSRKLYVASGVHSERSLQNSRWTKRYRTQEKKRNKKKHMQARPLHQFVSPQGPSPIFKLIGKRKGKAPIFLFIFSFPFSPFSKKDKFRPPKEKGKKVVRRRGGERKRKKKCTLFISSSHRRCCTPRLFSHVKTKTKEKEKRKKGNFSSDPRSG